MREFMIRLEGFLSRRRRWVVGSWLVVIALALPLASRQTEDLTGGGFDVPGSQSKTVSDAIERDFAGTTQGIGVVLKAERSAGPKQRAAAVKRLTETVADVKDVSLSPPAARRAEAQLQRNGETLVPIRSRLPSDLLTDPAVDLREQLDPGSPQGGVTSYLVGQASAWAGLQELSKEDLAKAETTGFPIVALILLAVFGSLAAAALPLALGFASVLVTGALIYLISQQLEMSVFVTNMASMLGIGVAVDYSLFILARFREEVRAGRSAAEARAQALSTSGLAVAFSGMAVIISLAGLWMVDNQTLRSMALGAMIVVAISILTAVTLLPALIRLLGYRVEAGGAPWRAIGFVRNLWRRRRRPGSTDPGREGFWQRWTERVMARPWLSVGAVATVMLTLAIPVLSMETGNGALKQFPKGHDVRVGFKTASALTGGAADPVQIVASFGAEDPAGPANRRAIESLVRTLRSQPNVRSVAPPQSRSGAVLIEATPRLGTESDATRALVERLRDVAAPRSQLAERATVDVGGESARIIDVRHQISGSMWRILLFILGFSFVVLTLMLRSLLLPLKAVLMNLLSIGAAYGVLVAVFQWGWLDGFLGFQSPGAVDTINPPLILAVIFGLSMDYEVFLLSRIREHYLEYGDNRRAVAEGLASSAGTISSAAVIMTAVFSVFALTGVPSIKEIGLGNAVAIALDATLVRLILVPAAMQLMGRWNWWMPAWLDRVLPDVSFDRGGAAQPAKV
jgi:RND superfamily putative drug exporter